MKPSDQLTNEPAPTPASRSSRVRRAALAVALGGGLALGVAGLAYADDASTGPPAPVATTSDSPPAGPPTARRDAAGVKHRPHLDGTVKVIGSGKIQIIDREGFTRQINTTAVPEGVVVGTRIHAEGTVNADGVSLDATSVAVAPEPGPGGPGKPGKAGAGAHGKPRPPAPPGGSAPAVPAPQESGAPSAPDPLPSGSAIAPAPSRTS